MFDIFYIGKKLGLFPHERPADSVEHAREQSRTRFCWVVNYLADYSSFDFLWEPVPWQSEQIHIWPSQHQANSGTYLVPKIVTDQINRDHAVVPRKYSVPKLGIDHGEGLSIPTDLSTRYIHDYLGTLRRILSKISDEYVWVVSSVCDYNDFDFTWHPSEWQLDMLHVFPSNEQKFGDTFFVHVPSFMAADKKSLLEWYNINHVEGISVPRRPMPMVSHTCDTHVDIVKSHIWTTPLTLFSINSLPAKIPTVNLWREKTKTIVPLNQSASTVIVPREAAIVIKKQLYDYPYIDKSNRIHAVDQQMDVIFISNGESTVDQNWKNLLNIFPGAKHSSGVDGRENAYKAAATLSKTPWFYAVFAKTEVYSTFKFDYQPDWMQQPKHYIFHSRNPLNNLEYGAMNVNLYNRQLVLDTKPGIDFTLSSAHEVVPLCISVSRFNTDPWLTWRSAFREVLKLRLEVDQGADVEIKYRLDTWLSVANGENAKWCLAGGRDAMQYYDQVNGDYEKLKLSFDWAWLQDYYYSLYKTQPWLKS